MGIKSKTLILNNLVFLLIGLVFLFACNDEDRIENGNNNDTTTGDPNDSVSSIIDFKVTITSSANHRGIKAYIFLDDSLCGKTNQNGVFSIKSLPAGKYELVCSAINYRDTSLQIEKVKGTAINLVFDLANDASTGRIYGEFQDMFVFRQKLQEVAGLATWDEKTRFDGVTGATMQKKNYTYILPDRCVLVNDENYKITDDFGQYWFSIQCGTYKLSGTCNGYRSSSSVIIKVLPDSKTYLNFYLERN